MTDPALPSAAVPGDSDDSPLLTPATLIGLLAGAAPPAVLDVRWRLPGSAPDR